MRRGRRRPPRAVWLQRAYWEYVDDWLWDEWGYARGWRKRLPEMVLWYATAGRALSGDRAADTVVKRIRSGRRDRLSERQRRTWEGARELSAEVCGDQATNPVEWFTGGCGSLEAGWRRLDAVYGVGPKIASFLLRDLSFFRDYSAGQGGVAVSYRKRRDRRWFRRLPPADQALFIPIDRYVHCAARRLGASPTIAAHDVATIQGDPDLHRQAAAEIARWARDRGLDPRDLDMYWYMGGAGNIHEDGTPVE